MSRKGFTIIELLVVIAIIGILATIILATTKTARNKSKDGVIKQDLGKIRTSASLYADGFNGVYGAAGTVAAPPACSTLATTMFFLDSNIKALLAEVGKYSTNVLCSALPNPNPTAWAVSASLNVPGGTFWCADSTGFSGEKPSAIVTSACP